MTTEATIDQLKRARTEGAVVIDVRESEEHAAGHVAGARSLPLSELPTRTHEVPTDQTVYLVCQGGGRSSQAAELLGAAGHDVRSVVGGTTAWREAGGEMESSRD
ncbi:MAG: rhodanese-like domain-containing protein [Mycobacteriales bacterium]|nr:rhodanese-like domain-containing protein [Mycobacteriales bacterium]